MANPWDIALVLLGWLVVALIALIIVAVLVATVQAIIRPRRKKQTKIISSNTNK